MMNSMKGIVHKEMDSKEVALKKMESTAQLGKLVLEV
jgi:hypothetical protein